jgi:hypothetical protein
MRINLTGLLFLLGISLFVGIVILSVGLGMAIAPLQGISAPLVCGGGEVERTADQYSYKPGQVGWEIGWHCIDRTTGERQDRTLAVIFASGTIYGLILFVGLIVWALKPAKKSK